MKNITTIVLIVWAVCFALCAVEIFRDLYRAVKSHQPIRYTYFIELAFWCLCMAPLAAALIGGSWFFELADSLYDKFHRIHEDKDIRV